MEQKEDHFLILIGYHRLWEKHINKQTMPPAGLEIVLQMQI